MHLYDNATYRRVRSIIILLLGEHEKKKTKKNAIL